MSEDPPELVFLSPEQYEVLRQAREEKQHDLSPEQVDALLWGMEDGAGPA